MEDGAGARAPCRCIAASLLMAAVQAGAVFLLFALATGALWFNRNFGQIDADQVFYHLQQSPAGLFKSSTGLVRGALTDVVLASMAYTLPAVLCLYALRQWRQVRLPSSRMLRWAMGPAGFIVAFGVVGAWASQLVFAPAAPGVAERDWMSTRFAMPDRIEPPVRKRNLVLVYAESLEFSFERGPFAGAGLLDPLDEEDLGGVSFPRFLQGPGTGWTIAGMVASQCGVPLKPVGVFGGNLLGEVASRFLAGARCLGDVLKEHGYRNVFLGGASPTFSGKGRFLLSHGYDEVHGREQWLAARPAPTINDWGADDEFLFEQAIAQLRRLKAAGQPFNLTLLTLGLHPPAGYISPACPRLHRNMRDAVHCTALLIRRFIDVAREEHLLDDTVVLVMGDHLSAKSELTPQLDAVVGRSIYNRLIVPAPLAPNRTGIDHFDIYPTLLAALGFRIGDGQLALGCAAIGEVRCRSLVDDPTAVAGLGQRSKLYESLWSRSRANGVGPEDGDTDEE